MFGLGTTELILILIIVLLLFGAKRLPEIGSALGKAIRNLRGAGSDEPEEGAQKEEKKDAGSGKKG